ncbi:ABC transporter permease [Kineococcus sp. SYSU DK006]|uniref:ABC transporter permease n=1 Tax=Kineococcus sp. SYSU DK006 TaxID=3383127 RepID=UPI003D7D0848
MSTLTELPATAAPVPAARTGGPLRALRHALALAGRSLVKTARTPEALIDVTVQPAIFLVMFTYIFGGAIAAGDRGAYLQFLVPGLLGQSIALAGVSLGTNLNDDITKGVFDRFRSLPIARSAPLVGAVLADLARYLVLFCSLTGFAWLMGFRVLTGPLELLAALGVSVAFALSFCWISVLVGMLVRTPGAVQGVMFLLVLPLSFGSNVFVDSSTMPGWLQAFVGVNPITHLVEVVRGLLLGGPVAGDLAWTGGWIAFFLLVFVPLALRAYNRRA